MVEITEDSRSCYNRPVVTVKIRGGPGTPGPAGPSDGGTPAPRSEPADRLSRAPDPSKAFLPPSPHAPHRGPEARTGGTAVELERRSGPPLYQSSHFEDPTSFMGKDEVELAKRLCHRIDAETWPELYLAFQAELKAARAEQKKRRSRSVALGADWWSEPWYQLELTPASVAAELAHARALGFRNIALAGEAELAALESVMAPATAQGLRSISELPLHPSELGLGDPVWLASRLRRVSEDVGLGILGFRTTGLHGTSTDASEGRPVHALQALLKLYLRTLSPTEILVPERFSPGAAVSLEAGGALELSGPTAPSEGDLIPWLEGRNALRAALVDGDRGPLDHALETLPTLLHGARLLGSLEDADLESSLLELVGWSPERLSLAFSLLYFMPATPIVSARSSRALPAGRSTLKLMNRLRAAHSALVHGDLWSVSPEAKEGLFWCRGRPHEPNGFFAIAANLSDHSLDLRVPRAKLESAGLDAAELMRPIGRARVWGQVDAHGLRVELPPFGVAFYLG